MNKQYILRDENGKMIGELPISTAKEIFSSCDGGWREYKVENEPVTRCFEIAGDFKIKFGRGEESITLYLWKGYKIIEIK